MQIRQTDLGGINRNRRQHCRRFLLFCRLRIRLWIRRIVSGLVSRLELLQETHVVLGEHAQVGHVIFQVGDAFDTQTKGVTRINGAVYAAGFKHIGVYHATTKDFNPTCMLAESTALAATDVARDVHFCAWFGEWEIAWAQADVGVGTEKFACKGEQHLF